MQNLENKVAVVTGAASGMGLSFAHRFARAGMKVVLADIEQPPLDEAATSVGEHGTEVMAVVTDVSDGDSMDALAEATFDAFGTAHVVCNNAGVAGGITAEAIDIASWKWVIDVNLWGVVHGHRVFLPRLTEQDEGHIVNTSSMAGHFPGHSAYSASKWAVVGITMGLHRDLATAGSNVGVSCLCPGWVRTKIADSDRNIPEWAAPRTPVEPDEEQAAAMAFIREALASGMDPDEVAELVHDAVVENRFWIFTDPSMLTLLEDKHASIVENRDPVPFGLME